MISWVRVTTMYMIYQLLNIYAISTYGFSLYNVSLLIDCLSSCSNETCVDTCNDYPNEIDFYPQVDDEYTEANVTLHCTGGNLMMINFNPGFYLIEQSSSNYTRNPPKLVKGNMATFTNLTANTNYQYRLYNLTHEGIWRPEVSDWFFTYPADYQPLPVKNLSLYKIEPYKKTHDLHAEFVFEPAIDRSCSYHVVTWNRGTNLLHFEIDRPTHFQFNLDCLKMDQNNSVFIKSVNKQNKKESEALIMFCTLTCLEYYNDLTFCPPEPVEGLRAEHIYRYQGLYDVWVHWNKTELEPDNYTIQIDLYRSDTKHYVKSVSGNTTEVCFERLKLGLQYEVEILAESLGGRSSVVTIIKSLDDEYATVSKFYRELIIGIVMSFTLFAIIWMTYLQHYKQKNNKFAMECTSFENLNQKDVSIESIKKLLYQSCDGETNNMPLMNDNFELCPKLLKLKGILGSGAYGIVRLGSLQDQYDNVTTVAVKMLKDNPSVENLQNFQKEIMIMKAVGQHPNIVSLIGCCILDNKPVLVVEYCCKGDLQTYLRTIWQNMVSVAFNHKARFKFDGDSFSISKNSGGKEHNYQNVHLITNRLYDVQQDIAQYTETVTANGLLNFARQIATGMEFLSLNRIVHRDLAARNILVCADKIVKISDFGLSRDVYQENLYRKQGNDKLPVKWMAIESLTHQIYTTHSDVWSFGILLWEIVTMGALPYPGIPTKAILKILKSGYRMERPISCSVELYNIMFSCWTVRPQSRPMFTQLKESIDKLLCQRSGNKYLNMDEILYDTQEQHGKPNSNHS
ncbi:tyrosine-protein kinase receptor torso-like isoform X1 [Osmia lignaria lignaria]|uniref:tyrosine-protein kinase receptor torso-like isoform X1 n=1 Tax=Osmia lignaria lignaria TaxID=1437193 RepID=UPI00402BB503